MRISDWSSDVCSSDLVQNLTPAFSFARAKDIALSDPQPLSFQDLILTLQHYWSERGCVILHPYDLEQGAVTFHPATTLPALGPNHCKAAYVQHSARPSAARDRSDERCGGATCASTGKP